MASTVKSEAKSVSESISMYSGELIRAIENRTKQLLADVDQNENSISLHIDSNLKGLCKSFGSIYPSNISPGKSYVDGLGMKVSVVDETSYISIRLVNDDNTSCNEDIPVSVQLEHVHTSNVTFGERVKSNGDTVLYRYTPFQPGQHLLHVKISNSNVGKSPFKINVTMPLRMKCIPQVALQGVTNKLGGVAIGHNGEIAIVDTKGYKTIHVYSSELELTRSFGDWGSGNGECYWPIGIVYDIDHNILITDTGNHRIHKYNSEGCLIKTVGKKGNGMLEFSRPTGISVNKTGLVYVCDRDNNRVQILTPDLEYKKEFGETGDTNNDLYYPWDVAFDSQGDVYVVDAGHACIKRFTPYGEFQSKIGPNMCKSEKLKSPEMICIDEYDYIFVTEHDRHEVVVFDTEGRYCTSFGCYGYAKGQFNKPRGIAKSKEGIVYVADSGNRRLQIFH